MNIKFTGISMCICCLSACGGGSDATGGVAAGGAAIPQYTTNVATFPSGSVLNVVTDFGIQNNTNQFDAVIAAENMAAADKVFDAFVKVNNREASVSLAELTSTLGDYGARAEGTVASGQRFSNTFEGIRLPSEGYVSVNTMLFDDGSGAFGTDGTSPFGATPLTAFYQGGAVHLGVRSSGATVVEDGTFQMNVDFANSTADLSSVSASGSLTASGILVSNIFNQINATGQISFDNQAPVPATIVGYFSGEDGAGVHGIGFETNETNGGLTTMFMGER